MADVEELLWWKQVLAMLDGEQEDRVHVAAACVKEARRVEYATLERAEEIIENYRIYGTLPEGAVSPQLASAFDDEPSSEFNAIAVGTDTLTAEMMQDTIRIMFVSRAGSWRDHRDSAKATSWQDDMVEEQELPISDSQIIRDGFIAGCGWYLPYVDHEDIKTEPLFPTNVLVDDLDGSRKPPVIWVRRPMDRWRALEFAEGFEDHFDEDVEEAIRRAGSNARSFFDGAAGRPDRVELWEGWRVASRDDADDGVHVIVIEGAVIFAEKYKSTRHQVCCFRPIPPAIGFWGESMVRRAYRLQRKLNEILQQIDWAFAHHAHGWMAVPLGTETDQITNAPGIVFKTPNPQAIVFAAPNPMPPQFFDHRDWVRSGVLETFAVNEMQAQGTKPTGLDSGIAIRRFVDVGSKRYIDVRRQKQLARAELFKVYVRLKSELEEQGVKQKAVYRRHNVSVETSWSSLARGLKDSRIVPFPSSSLPNEPSGRSQALSEMRADGKIDADTFWKTQTGDLDVESVVAEFTAPVDFVRYQLDTILDEEEYVGPWPDCVASVGELGLQIATQTIFKEAMAGCPEDLLDLLRLWRDEYTHYLDEEAANANAMAPPADPMAAMAGGAPMMDPAMAGIDPALAAAAGAPPMMPPGPGMMAPDPNTMPPMPMPMAAGM